MYVCVSLCFRTHMCACLDKNLVHRDQCCGDDILTNQQKEMVHIMYNESWHKSLQVVTSSMAVQWQRWNHLQVSSACLCFFRCCDDSGSILWVWSNAQRRGTGQAQWQWRPATGLYQYTVSYNVNHSLKFGGGGVGGGGGGHTSNGVWAWLMKSQSSQCSVKGSQVLLTVLRFLLWLDAHACTYACMHTHVHVQRETGSTWSVNRVVSHQGGILLVWSPLRVVSLQGVSLSAEWSLVSVVPSQGGLSAGCFTVSRVVSWQDGLSAGWPFSRVVYQERGCLSGWSVMRVVCRQGGLLSGWSMNRVV